MKALWAAMVVVMMFTVVPVSAQDRLSLSNKTEVRYGKVFVSDKVIFQGGELVRNSLSLGAVSDVSRRIQYKTFYTLQNSLKSQWIPEYILGFSFEYKFR